MKYLVLLLALSGCGYSSRDNEMIGQVTRVVHETPLICPNWWNAHVSLGVMRNGVGSMSHQDVNAYVQDPAVLQTLKKAGEVGALVKMTYDSRRIAICIDNWEITKAEIVAEQK